MCQHCEKEVIEMGILESDLPTLPFTIVKWLCMVEGCTCAVSVRDYGIPPYYYWPVNIRRGLDGWRGGWFSVHEHGKICSKHYDEQRTHWNNVLIREDMKQIEYLESRIIKPKK